MANRVQLAWDALRGRLDKATTTPPPAPAGVQPLSTSEMIETNPTIANVPSTWQTAMLPPGFPVAPIQPYGLSERDKQLAELEPRSYQYYPAFNSNLTPRIYLGLMPFSLLKWYNETIPEAALFRRMRVAALTDFIPQIVDRSGEVIQKAEQITLKDAHGRPLRDARGQLQKVFTGRNTIARYPELGWLTTQPFPAQRTVSGVSRRFVWTESDGSHDPSGWLTKDGTTPPPDRWDVRSEEMTDLRWQVARPDRFNAWPQWLSRFMVNYIHYNAPAVYRIRDNRNQIVGLRVIDGSTLFLMIDPRGETPAPPAPAFSQIIWGTPKAWYNTYQLWYHPYPLRPDSPYGYTSAEDGKYYLDFLYQYWQWWMSQYNARQIPLTMLKTPPGTMAEPIFEFLRVMQAQMKGNFAEQQTLYPLPPGTEPVDIKHIDSKGYEYETAVKYLALTYNVHPSELGIVSGGTGLTGSQGLAEKGEEQMARIGVIPDHLFVEMLFNDILLEMAEIDPRYEGLTWQLGAPDAVINPQIEDQKWDQVWQLDGMTLNEYRDRKGLGDVAGEKGDMTYSEVSGKNKQAAGPATEAGPQPPAAEEKPPEQAVPEQAAEEKRAFANLPIADYAGFEKVWQVTDLRKHCGVCPEDDDYFGAPISRAESVLYPHQGANETEIVSLSPSGREPRPALWKPEGGEDERLVEALGGMQYVREEAAYLVDRMLNYRLVPLAYVAEVDGERGAAIMYVRGNEPRAGAYDDSWVEKAAVLDYVIGQCDRRTHNVLTHPEDETRPLLIDNGLSFPVREMQIGSMFVEAYRGRELDPSNLTLLKRLMGRIEWEDIAALVGEPAVQLAQDRAQALITAGQIPL